MVGARASNKNEPATLQNRTEFPLLVLKVALCLLIYLVLTKKQKKTQQNSRTKDLTNCTWLPIENEETFGL